MKNKKINKELRRGLEFWNEDNLEFDFLMELKKSKDRELSDLSLQDQYDLQSILDIRSKEDKDYPIISGFLPDREFFAKELEKGSIHT